MLVSLQAPDGGVVPVDSNVYGEQLKQLVAIFLGTTAGYLHRQSEVSRIIGVEKSIEAIIESVPEELRAAAWDAWLTKPEGLV